jgi:excinuclease ABC subunit A
VQRINLTTALGTSLVNTLFVLDEPSIGLHPRDMGRVIGVMTRLRDAGNTLVVVEHDPQIMLAADRLLDIGPGPGRARRRDRVLRPPRGDRATPTRSPPTTWPGANGWTSGRQRRARSRPADRRLEL